MTDKPTRLSVVNNVLGEIGEPKLADLTASDARSNNVNGALTAALQEIIMTSNWVWSRKAFLPGRLDEESPYQHLQYVFVYPSDVAANFEVVGDDGQTIIEEYIIENGKLYSDQNKLLVRYNTSDVRFEEIPQYLHVPLHYLLKYKLTEVLARDSDIVSLQIYQEKIRKAIAKNYSRDGGIRLKRTALNKVRESGIGRGDYG